MSMAAVVAVQKMRSRKDSMSSLLRLLYATSVRHSFEFRCVHVKGITNIVADLLSRDCTLPDLLQVLPTAELLPTPAPPLPTDGGPMVAWKQDDPQPADSPHPPP